MLAAVAGLTSCGGGNSVNPDRLMGGSMQGKALSLANTVSTIAGSTANYGSSSDASFASPNNITKIGVNLFVADFSNHTIRKVDITTGAVTTIAGTTGVSGSADGTGAAARFKSPTGITTDGANLFVTDKDNNNIRKIVIATAVVTTVAGTAGVSGSTDGAGASASFASPRGIATDNANLFVSDSDNHTIRKIAIATGVVTTLAGTAGVPGTADGIGTAANFYLPYGIVADGAKLFVADAYNSTIRSIVIATGAVTTIAGTAGVPGIADGTGTAASFYLPHGITTDGTSLFVTDGVAQTIRKIVLATGAVSTIAGTAGLHGVADGTGAAARFNTPYGLAVDGSNLFVADSGNNAIRKVVIATGVTSTVAGTVALSGSTDGTGAVARFDGPAGMTTDGANLYIAENINNTIRKVVISTGVVSTLAGTAGVSGSADGAGATASFSWPNGITTDGSNLFVTDAGANTLRKIVIATGMVTTMAGKAGVAGAADGTGTAASFSMPAGITTDSVNLFVTDAENHTIRKIVIATGVVTTMAGKAGVAGAADGTGTAASFNMPYGIATDGTTLFVADADNFIIRQIAISTGVVSTIAGKAGVSGSKDGTGADARFSRLGGLTTDGANLFVVDANSGTIRKIVISTGVVTTIAGNSIFGFADGTGTAAKFNLPDGITSDGSSLYIADNFNNLIRRIR
jgi:hypothetical protein